MTDDLVEQLLQHLRFGGGAGVQVRASSCLPLADAIEALTAERDRLRQLLSEIDKCIVWEALGFGNDFADQVQAALKGETP